MNPFNVGDRVRYIGTKMFTVGSEFTVSRLDGLLIRIYKPLGPTPNVYNVYNIHHKFFELVPSEEDINSDFNNRMKEIVSSSFLKRIKLYIKRIL